MPSQPLDDSSRPSASRHESSDRVGGTGADLNDDALEVIRGQFETVGGISPRLRNIPVRFNPSSPSQTASPAGAQSTSLASGSISAALEEPETLDLTRSGGQGTPLRKQDGTSRPISTLGSGANTPDLEGDVDALPITDEQKARIIERHLSRHIDAISSSSASADGGEAAGDLSAVAHTGPYDVEAGNNSSVAGTPHEASEEEYFGPHHMQGGAITDDVYKWAHNTKRKQARRSRSESLHLPRTSSIDPSLDTQGIREPGGFRRHYVAAQAAEQGRPRPRALRSFIDFLSLYGHFAGEYLEEEDENEEDDEGGDRNAAGPSERTPLLGGRVGDALGTRMDPATASRIRRAQHNKEPGEASVTEAVMMLLKSFVGTGILFLGKAFMNGGLLFSSIVLCAVAMISLTSFLLLVKANLKVPASFGDMGGILYGPKMRLAILASIVFSQLGFVAAYTVFVAQNLQAFILAVSHCRTLVPTVYLILAQCAIFLPLSLIRRIAKLSSTALVADAFILFGICYLFYYETGLVRQRGLADVALFNAKSWPLFIGTAVFSFEGVGLVIPITESMKEPHRFPSALSGVMIGVMVLFAAAGALSYSAFGSQIQTVVISNLPQDSKFVQAMQFLYSLAILLSTPLQLFPALSILERGIFTTKSGKYNWQVKLQKNLFRCSIVIVSAFGAYLGSSSLDVFVSFIGSVACVPLCFIYPPLLHLKACATKPATRALNYALLAFGTACMLFAGTQTIRELLNPGAPPDKPVCTPPKGY